jgi:mRNA interferase MazF
MTVTTARAQPARGEVWLVNLDPVQGHEQGGPRPALVISITAFNRGPQQLAVILPITRTPARTDLHLPIQPPEGGLRAPSTVRCDQPRTLSTAHRFRTRWGVVSDSTLADVEMCLRFLLNLP